MDFDERLRRSFLGGKNGPFYLLIGLIALVFAVLTGMIEVSKREPVESGEYVEFEGYVARYPELTGQARTALADRVVTKGELLGIRKAATELQRERTATRLTSTR